MEMLFEFIPQDEEKKKRKQAYKNCIGEILSEELEERGMTSATLSELLNIPESKISDWKNGKATPLADGDLLSLALFLNLPLEYLCYGLEKFKEKTAK